MEFKKGDIVIYFEEGGFSYGAEFKIISDRVDGSGDLVGVLLNDTGDWETYLELADYYSGPEEQFFNDIDFPENPKEYRYSFTIHEYGCKHKYKKIPDTKLARNLYKNIHKEEGDYIWVAV
jgi:hypothetical protein